MDGSGSGKSPSYDVIIVGGGFAGLVTAAALANGRRRVLVIEARDAFANRFSGELIHPAGVSILGRLGLLDRLRASTQGATVDGFVVSLHDDGEARIPYERVLGFSCNHVAMVEAMRPEVQRRTGVTIRRGVRVRELLRKDSRVSGVRTEEGEELLAPLVLAADGRHSKMRLAAGLTHETELLSFTAAPLIQGEDLPNPGHGHIFVGAWGPILAYPTEGGRARMCIDLPPELERGAVRERIADAHAPFLPSRLRAALLKTLDEDALEMCATHKVFTRSCIVPGLALVGDAGGCSHPLTAAGMTIALHDAETMAAELDAIPTSSWAERYRERMIDAALSRYQSKRYAFVRAREHLATAMYEVFRGTDAGSRAVARGLMHAWRENPELRKSSMAILSCHESRAGAFLSSYLQVAGRSTREVLSGQSGLRARTKSLVGLARLSVGKVSRVLAS
ncbi:N/A [soil metagenome]